MSQVDWAVAVLFSFILVGCAARLGPEVLTPVAASAGEKTVQIYVATTREREISSGNVFTANRANAFNFAKFVVWCPLTTSPAISKCRPQLPIHGAVLL